MMKPVLVIQHMRDDRPSYLATWLAAEGVAMDLRCPPTGDALPATMAGHAALAVLGGAMSANDDLPALRQCEHLIREAMAQERPVIGHCLGGQLMARALGATVRASSRPEVGWHRVQWQDGAVEWFGDAADSALVFQWHYEAFDLPPGARRLATGAACANQAFAVGPHLAMQFHVELDADKLRAWCEAADPAHVNAMRQFPEQVQTVEAMRNGAGARLTAQQRLADSAYRRWLAPVRAQLFA